MNKDALHGVRSIAVWAAGIPVYDQSGVRGTFLTGVNTCSMEDGDDVHLDECAAFC